MPFIYWSAKCVVPMFLLLGGLFLNVHSLMAQLTIPTISFLVILGNEDSFISDK